MLLWLDQIVILLNKRKEVTIMLTIVTQDGKFRRNRPYITKQIEIAQAQRVKSYHRHHHYHQI